MGFLKRLGMLLLAIWLILTGLVELLNFSFNGLQVIMAILAIAAGVLLFFYRQDHFLTGKSVRDLCWNGFNTREHSSCDMRLQCISAFMHG